MTYKILLINSIKIKIYEKQWSNEMIYDVNNGKKRKRRMMKKKAHTVTHVNTYYFNSPFPIMIIFFRSHEIEFN